MANKFLSKKIIIPAVIFFGGLLIVFGVLLFPNLLGIASVTAGQNSQWTQSTGEGISAPACASADITSTCSGNQPLVTFNLSGSSSMPPGSYALYINYPAVIWSNLGLSVPGSVTIPAGILANNTTYTYLMQDLFVDANNIPFTTPNCAPPVNYILSVSKTGTGSGTVTSNPAGISCGSTCSDDFNYNTSVTLTASPATGSDFTGWSGGGCSGTGTCTVVMTSNKNVTATFALEQKTLSVSKTGTGSGTVTSNPAGISCGSTCSDDFNYNTSVILTASPATGSDFTGWSGGGCSGTGTCTVVMTANKNVTATFVLELPGNFTLSSPSATCNSIPLSWTASANADGYNVLKGSSRVVIAITTALNFTDTTVSQNTSYLYQIEAYNSAGTNRSNALNVTTPFCPATLDFSGDPTSIFQGQSTELTWLTTFATSCTASGAWTGSKPINGSEIVFPAPPPSVTYRLQCSGPGGLSPLRSVIINISSLALPEFREIIPR
ncbi:MAG: hypothetical protein Q7K16_01970 [Candidatus Azambacteria bacterium]|nr:hypothetical protein [Candidatus Azambacteria bacterium]